MLNLVKVDFFHDYGFKLLSLVAFFVILLLDWHWYFLEIRNRFDDVLGSNGDLGFASETSDVFDLFCLAFTWVRGTDCVLGILYLSYLTAIFAPVSSQYMTSLNLFWAQGFSTKRDLLSNTIVR